MTLEEYKQNRDKRASDGKKVINFFTINTLQAIHDELLGVPHKDRINAAIGVTIKEINKQLWSSKLSKKA